MLIGPFLLASLSGVVPLDRCLGRNEAVDLLMLELENNAPVQLQPGHPDRGFVQHTLEGLLHRLRTRGAVFHPLLSEYVVKGQRFFLAKLHHPALSVFTPETPLPRFLYVGSEHKHFDVLAPRGTARTWLRDFCYRSLNQRAFEILKRVGLVDRTPSGSSEVIGLRPEAMLVTSNVVQLHCSLCHKSLTIPRSAAARWNAARCTRYRCKGYLELTGYFGPLRF